MPYYKRKRYSHASEKYEVRKTGEQSVDEKAEKVVEALNRGAKSTALRLAIYYGIPSLISLCYYAIGLGYAYYAGVRI